MSGENHNLACARCPAVLGRSCCQVADGEHLATLTLADVARIRTATGRSAETFVTGDWFTHDEVLAYERHRPLFAGYFRREQRRLTLRRRAGACVFHSAERGGCQLSPEVRPVACKLYPFEPLHGGGFTLLPERYDSLEEARAAAAPCLAVQESASLAGVMRAFGVTEGKLRTWVGQLKAEVAAHASGTPRSGGY